MHLITFIAAVLASLRSLTAANGSGVELTTTSTTTLTSTAFETLTATVIYADEHVDVDVEKSPVQDGASTSTDTSSAAKSTQTTGSNPSPFAIADVCFPKIDDELPNLAYPCNTAEYLLRECVFGFARAHNLSTVSDSLQLKNDSEEPPSNSDQRLCACGSHMFNEYIGCTACLNAHGCDMLDSQKVHKISRSYCAASATPTEGLMDAVRPLLLGLHSAKAMRSVQGPLQHSTAVSLYFTPPVTGSAALWVPEVTKSAGKTVLGVNTEHGQLVPLHMPCATGSLNGSLGQNATISSHVTPPSSTPNGGNSGSSMGADRESAMMAAVVGFAAVIAMV